MSTSLKNIAEQLRDATHTTRARAENVQDVKVQLIYAFNGTGKTRLSKEFAQLILSEDDADEIELTREMVLYYNAFTEDLFYWDNDLEYDRDPRLLIQPNSFIRWILQDQGQDQNIIENFQHYTDEKLTPRFSEDYNSVSFSYARGNDECENNIKISKGEESCFVWSVFYTLLELVIETLNIPEPEDRDTDEFDNLKYVFIDDPVSSLDENHLIELAVDLASLIKSSQSDLRFIITTHNPLFYNVLHNEFRKAIHKKYIFKKLADGDYELKPQPNDTPFSYHLYLKTEIEKAIEEGQIKKYHFNFLRNILEKTSTFLGYQKWGDLLAPIQGSRESYETRLINISSHSKHSGDEVADLDDDDKRVLAFLIRQINEIYRFKSVDV